MFQLFTCLLLATVLQAQDLKSIFQTPNKRNYDELGILERSNFIAEHATPVPAIEAPQPIANAQVLLRIGDVNRRCGCGDVCHCRNEHFYTPVIHPIPFYYHHYYPTKPAPCVVPVLPRPNLLIEEPNPNLIWSSLLPKPEQILIEDNPTLIQNGPLVEEIFPANNHPQILDPVTLSEDVAAPVIEEEIVGQIDPTEVSPNVKFVSVNLGRSPKCFDLEESLVPYVGPQPRPKYLVSYPIFKQPRSEIFVPRVLEKVTAPRCYGHTSYSISGSSGYLSDPSETVVYKKPTVLTVVPPAPRCVSVVNPPVGDCGCCTCNRNVGEINEYLR